MPEENRYAKDWNGYSRSWEDYSGRGLQYLGDEWADPERDETYFNMYAARFLEPDLVVMEVGVGGGKYTVRLAPLVKKVIAFDVAEEMLRRTKDRCDQLGITNVEFIKGNGVDFQPVPDCSVDFFFSFDVFVHIAMEDTWPYTQEIARVLKPNACSSVHYAINSVPDAWNRIQNANYVYRAGYTLGQYYYHSSQMLRRMYERVGLAVREVSEFYCYSVLVAQKPVTDIVPRLERLLQAMVAEPAEDPSVRADVARSLRDLPGELERALAPLLDQLQAEQNRDKRCQLVDRLRAIWRGGLQGDSRQQNAGYAARQRETTQQRGGTCADTRGS